MFFCQIDLLNITIVFDFLSYVHSESSYIVWERIISGLSYIEQMISSDLNLYEEFQSYIIELLIPISDQLGWKEETLKLNLNQFHRDLILSISCRLNFDHCVKQSEELFDEWLNNPSNNSIEPNVRSIVYCTSIRLGNRIEFQFLLNQYKESNDPQEKSRIQTALSCTRDIQLIRYFIEIHFNSQLNLIRRQDVLSGLRTICRNFLAQTECWSFLRSNWNQLFQEFGQSISFPDFIKDLTQGFNTEQQLNELELFVEQTKNLGSLFESIIERIRGNIQWIQKTKPNLVQWFNNRRSSIRLPLDWIPSQYQLHFDVYLRSIYFNNDQPDTTVKGYTQIYVRCHRSTNQFRIHIKQLQISSVTLKRLNSSKNLLIDCTAISISEIFLCQLTERCLINEEYLFQSEYTTQLNRDNAGFYLSQYSVTNQSTNEITTHYIATTHMQVISILL